MSEPIFVEKEPGISFEKEWAKIEHLESIEIWPPAVFLAFCQRGIRKFAEWEARQRAAVPMRRRRGG